MQSNDAFRGPTLWGFFTVDKHMNSVTHCVLVVAQVKRFLHTLQRENVGDHLASVHDSIQGHLYAFLKVAAHVNIPTGLRGDNRTTLSVQFEEIKVFAWADAAWRRKTV